MNRSAEIAFTVAHVRADRDVRAVHVGISLNKADSNPPRIIKLRTVISSQRIPAFAILIVLCSAVCLAADKKPGLKYMIPNQVEEIADAPDRTSVAAKPCLSYGW